MLEEIYENECLRIVPSVFDTSYTGLEVQDCGRVVATLDWYDVEELSRALNTWLEENA